MYHPSKKYIISILCQKTTLAKQFSYKNFLEGNVSRIGGEIRDFVFTYLYIIV